MKCLTSLRTSRKPRRSKCSGNNSNSSSSCKGHDDLEGEREGESAAQAAPMAEVLLPGNELQLHASFLRSSKGVCCTSCDDGGSTCCCCCCSYSCRNIPVYNRERTSYSVSLAAVALPAASWCLAQEWDAGTAALCCWGQLSSVFCKRQQKPLDRKSVV